jgi:lysophosphatidate acyltransferase
VRGETQLLAREGACVIVANHQSSIDLLGMFVIWGQLRRVAALAKQSLMYYGSFGECC